MGTNLLWSPSLKVWWTGTLPSWRARTGVPTMWDDSGSFCVCACYGVHHRELAHAERSHHRRQALDAGISICRVACIQLVAVPDPVKARRLDVVQQLQVEIAGNPVD